MLTVEMGVLTIEDKLIQVDMLRLEVGSKGLRADVPHERDAEAFERDAIDGTRCLHYLLQGMRVTYVTEMFPISRSLSTSCQRTDEWDPY